MLVLFFFNFEIMYLYIIHTLTLNRIDPDASLKTYCIFSLIILKFIFSNEFDYYVPKNIY